MHLYSKLTLSASAQARGYTLRLIAFFIVAFVLSVFIPSGFNISGAPSAWAQSAQDVQSRLQRLENELQTLSRAVFRGETPPAGAAAPTGSPDLEAQANLQVRITQLESQLSTLTGQLEEQRHEMRRLHQTLQEATARIEALESAPTPQATPLVNEPLSSQTGQAPEITPEGTAPAVSPSVRPLGTLRQGDADMPPGTVLTTPGGPADLYEQAFSLLRNQDYAAAQARFQEFLERHPDDALAANAKYWLGETFYVRGNFEQAARVFAETYQDYPEGGKGPDSLLKLGMSLANTGDEDSACLTYTQLRSQYPEAESVIARAQREMDRLECRRR